MTDTTTHTPTRCWKCLTALGDILISPHPGRWWCGSCFNAWLDQIDPAPALNPYREMATFDRDDEDLL